MSSVYIYFQHHNNEYKIKMQQHRLFLLQKIKIDFVTIEHFCDCVGFEK